MSQEASGLKEDRKKVFKRAFFMATGTLTSRILGLLRDVALGALFDRTVTDAWTAAFRIPNLFRRLLGEGALSVSFIPVFMEARAADAEGRRSRNLMNGFYTLLLIVLGTLTLLGLGFTEEIFRFLLSENYGLTGAKWDLTVRLGRIMFGFVFFVCTYAYFMGILNALGSFGLPALAPALLNVSMLIFTFLPGSWFAQIGDGLAWGVLFGGVLQAGLLWAALSARDFLPKLTWRFWNRDIQSILRNMLPGFLGMGLAQFATMINLYFASSLPEGSISYVYWADRLLELPLSLISVSLGAALLPTLSTLAARGEWRRFEESARETVLMNLFLAWPAALGLFFLAEPIVEALFLRGRFTLADVHSTGVVLKVYAVSLVFMALSRTLMPLYYAIQNTWFPALVSVLCLAGHVVVAPLLIQEYGLAGLVISGALASLLNAVSLAVGLSFWGLPLSWLKSVGSVVKTLVAGGALVLTVQKYEFLRFGILRGHSTLALVLTIVVSVLAYFGAAKLLRSEEMEKVLRAAARGDKSV